MHSVAMEALDGPINSKSLSLVYVDVALPIKIYVLLGIHAVQ